MKGIILSIFIITFMLTGNAFAANSFNTYKYFDCGYLYTNMYFPVDAAENQDFKNLDSQKLKVGKSNSCNIFMLVDVGDSSIDTAVKKAGITKIRYVDAHFHKVFVPVWFLPIYVRHYKTVVYGE